MARPLTTCERRGTVISHRGVDSVATITGTAPEAFEVEQNGKKYLLPFERVEHWEVIKEVKK